jgi:hypothetical protein
MTCDAPEFYNFKVSEPNEPENTMPEETGENFSEFHDCFKPLYEHMEQRIARRKADESINWQGPIVQSLQAVYITPDGQQFKEHSEAIKHRLAGIIKSTFDNDPLYSDAAGGRVSLTKISAWVVDNVSLIEAIKAFHELTHKKTNE